MDAKLATRETTLKVPNYNVGISNFLKFLFKKSNIANRRLEKSNERRLTLKKNTNFLENLSNFKEKIDTL